MAVTTSGQATTNPYCQALGIRVPRLETARQSPDANFYSLLIVALLERGEPLTLAEVAGRFEEAGVAPAARALASLKRCKPARAPVYRDGDRYALDPHDDESDLWVFRLGLRPPRVPALTVVRPAPPPLPAPDEPLAATELEEAWRDGVPSGWSAQRAAICVLDAHRTAMLPDRVVAFVRARSRWSPLATGSAAHWRQGAAIHVREDGTWELHGDHEAVHSARCAVRERLAQLRRRAETQPDPAVIAAHRARFERERAANAERLAHMRRVIVHAFPAQEPRAVVLVDVHRRDITTFFDDEIATAREALGAFDHIAAVDVRALLRRLGIEPGERRLGELGPPRKSTQLNRQGRTLRITTSLLVQGSCGIGRPFGDERVLRGYLDSGERTKLRRRLEADAKSLFALYQYGRLHGSVRLRWGFLDEMIPAPWVHRDEPMLYSLMDRAHALRVPLEVVVGSAPGWSDPWARARLAWVQTEEIGWRSWLVDGDGRELDRGEVQLARLAAPDASAP